MFFRELIRDGKHYPQGLPRRVQVDVGNVSVDADEDTLLTISTVLAKGKKMPVWMVVAAQAACQK